MVIYHIFFILGPLKIGGPGRAQADVYIDHG